MKKAGVAGVGSGFTIVELLIVVVILGILAAIVLPVFGRNLEETRQTTFASDVRAFASAAKVYMVRTGEFLADTPSANVPLGWEVCIDVEKWGQPTPIGGLWVVSQDKYGIKSGFGVEFESGIGPIRDEDYMLQIDKLFDDGDLATGEFRKVGPLRYYFVLQL